MLVEFAIDKDAIQDTDTVNPLADADLADSIIENLRRIWQRHGVLVSTSLDQIAHQVRMLNNEEARDLWENFLKRVNPDIEIDAALTEDDRDDAWKEGQFLIDPNRNIEGAEIILLSKALAQKRKIPSRESLCLLRGDCKSKPCFNNCKCLPGVKCCECFPNVERCKCLSGIRRCKELIGFTRLLRSRKFEKVEFLSRAPVSRGNTIVDLWEDRLSSLASRSSNVTIVDQYALKDIDTAKDGLKLLLEKIDGCRAVKNVTIYASARGHIKFTSQRAPELPKKPTAADYIKRVRFVERYLKGVYHNLKNIEMLRIYMPRTFLKAHARHVRFDEFRVCAIDLGPTEGIQASRNATFSYLVGPGEVGIFLEHEKYLMKSTPPRTNLLTFPSDGRQSRHTGVR